jgi:hypothetical protein
LAGFEVAVDDGLVVGVFQGLGDLSGDAQGFFDGEATSGTSNRSLTLRLSLRAMSVRRMAVAPRLRSGQAGRMEQVGEGFARDVFHDQSVRVAGVFDTVDLRNVGMIERGEQRGLAAEAGEAVGVARELLGEDFEGHVALQLGIVAVIDLAHTAFADEAPDFVLAQHGSGFEGHVHSSDE